MKNMFIASLIWAIICGLGPGICAADTVARDPMPETQDSQSQKPTDASPDKPELKKKVPQISAPKGAGAVPASGSAVIPVYRPPMRGSPVGRVAGGTRGIVDEYPHVLCVLTPDHKALTISEQPVLYWFVRELPQYPIELTVIADDAIYPILEKRLDPPSMPGINRIRLSDFGIKLRMNVVYRWYVAIVFDPKHRSKDILAWGAIEYQKASNKVLSELAAADKYKVPSILADLSIWYDAFEALTQLIEAQPDSIELRRQRASLLEQIGLPEVAQFEMPKGG